jgi:hypothetical protein
MEFRLFTPTHPTHPYLSFSRLAGSRQGACPPKRQPGASMPGGIRRRRDAIPRPGARTMSRR